MPDIFVGRQPIYDRKIHLFGYELLFRSGENTADAFKKIGADGATSTTLVNSYLEFGLDKLVRNHFAFINLTENFLLSEEALPISPKQVVLEVLENITITADIVKAVERLKLEGFIIALDDYIYNPSHKALISLVDIIKIDVLQLDQQQLIEHVNTLKQHNVKLLAEKVETMDEFAYCHKIGFDYFQGYFLSKPRVIKSTGLASNKLAVLNLLSILMNPDSQIEEIEEAMAFDVSISYKMLKLINSAIFNLSRKVDSIQQAIVILGRKKLRSWASMIALANLEERPSEMVHLAMTRAKMCEILAEKAGLPALESFFTVGLFSALDILMEKELTELISPLPLDQDIVDALLKHQGGYGEALQCVLAYEVSDFQQARFMDLSLHEIFVTNVEAVTWANMVVDID
jgi:EAL and modified HD-GYP domain-containing signal transduction protein